MKIKLLKKGIVLFFFIVSITTASAKLDAQNEASVLLDSVRKDLTSLSADFVQYEIDVNGNDSEKLKGKVWLRSPNQFKWQYIEPIPQLIVASGSKVWIYDEDLEQVSIKKQRNTQNPIYVLLNKKQTDENYTISLISNEKPADKTQWIKMVPKSEVGDVKVVWLGIKDNNLISIKLQNQLDTIVVFEFHNSHKNPKLSEKFFTFEIPKGIDVIQEETQPGEF